MTVSSSPPRPLAVPTTPARRTVGILRLAAACLVFAAIVTQIVDQLTAGVFVPAEYFSYFTVQSSMMNVVVLGTGGYLALRYRTDTTLYTGVRMATVTYAVVTGVVYNLLLRGLPPTGYVGIQWPNEVEHVWIPLYILIDWLFATGRARLAWTWIWAAIAFPLVWCAFTLVRGTATGWFPYPFINPNEPAGVVGVVGYIVGIASFIVGLAFLAIAYSRWRGRLADE
jgi:hypothetical protein